MQHPDEGTIHAWLDGALSDEETKAVESHVAECGDCAAAVAEARGLIAASSRIVSALDVVPGGVIPAAKPRHAAWYTNTQLRAAAAVIIVAGASLLVMRNERKEEVMQPARPMLAAAPAATPPAADEKPTEADKAVAQIVAPVAPKATKVASLEKAASPATTGARRENSQKQVAADELAPAAPSPNPPVASEIRADAARAIEPQRALFGKVSGAAVTGAAFLPELHQVRADTTASAHRTIYEVAPGVEVTLLEAIGPLPAGAAVLSATAAEGKVAQRTVAPPVTNAPRDVTANSISWTSKLGRVMTLSGSLSKEELQALRLRLPAEKQ
jgi:anti-sigma factor RsiW